LSCRRYVDTGMRNMVMDSPLSSIFLALPRGGDSRERER
jgi:hypothetical protein